MCTRSWCQSFSVVALNNLVDGRTLKVEVSWVGSICTSTFLASFDLPSCGYYHFYNVWQCSLCEESFTIHTQIEYWGRVLEAVIIRQCKQKNEKLNDVLKTTRDKLVEVLACRGWGDLAIYGALIMHSGIDVSNMQSFTCGVAVVFGETCFEDYNRETGWGSGLSEVRWHGHEGWIDSVLWYGYQQ